MLPLIEHNAYSNRWSCLATFLLRKKYDRLRMSIACFCYMQLRACYLSIRVTIIAVIGDAASKTKPIPTTDFANNLKSLFG